MLSVSSDVDDERGIANVYVLLRGEGKLDEVGVRDIMILLCWTRKDGAWRCIEKKAVKGVNGYRSGV